jgi:hypothetical protein
VKQTAAMWISRYEYSPPATIRPFAPQRSDCLAAEAWQFFLFYNRLIDLSGIYQALLLDSRHFGLEEFDHDKKRSIYRG